MNFHVPPGSVVEMDCCFSLTVSGDGGYFVSRSYQSFKLFLTEKERKSIIKSGESGVFLYRTLSPGKKSVEAKMWIRPLPGN